MNELRWTELAAQVVAWHNRNPLARRISVMHVHSLGYVMLPFVDAARPADGAGTGTHISDEALPPEALSGSLRERAMERARLVAGGAAAQPDDAPHAPAAPDTLRAAFDEDFFPPFKPAQVQRWASRQAVAQSTPRGDVQVRKVKPEAGLPADAVLPRWVLTAQVEVGRSKTRVLVGPGERPAVLGHRLLSLGRAVVLFALVGVLAGVAGWVTDRAGSTAPNVLAAAAPTSAAASAPSPKFTPVSAPTSMLASAPTASAPPALAASAPERPIDVEPRLGKVELPALGPGIDARRRAVQAAQQASAPAASTPAAGPTPTSTAAAPRPAPSVALELAFAVSTRLMRTRSESEQVATAMRELLTHQAGAQVRVEVVPAGDDWRVVGFPYADRATAEKARELLAGRGMKVQVVEF